MAAKKNRRKKTRVSMRKVRFYGFALIPLIIAIIFLKGDSGLINQVRLMKKMKNLQNEIRELELRQEQLEEEIRLLESDTDYIEKIAREEYNLGKPDELLFILKEEKKDF